MEWRSFIAPIQPEREVSVLEAYVWAAVIDHRLVVRHDWHIPKAVEKGLLRKYLGDFGSIIASRKSPDSYHSYEVVETENGVVILDDDKVRAAGKPEWINELSVKIESFLKIHVKDEVYVLSAEHGNLDLSELPTVVSEELVPDNYTSETLDNFEHLAYDLAAHKPCGRLVLLHGLPRNRQNIFHPRVVEETRR